MAQVIIYTTNWCPYCNGAKALLRSKSVEFEEIDVTDDRKKRAEMERLSRRRTVPQIFIDGRSDRRLRRRQNARRHRRAR